MDAVGARPGQAAQRGMVAAEFALIMPMLLMLFILLVEAGNALKVYYTLSEASRDAARLVLSQGDAKNVEQLVRSITTSLPKTSLKSVVDKDDKNKRVTVELIYDYQTLVCEDVLAALGWSLPTFRARTTMPLP